MNVGKIISGSQLLQGAESIQKTTTAEERSISESHNKGEHSVAVKETVPYASQLPLEKKQVKEMVKAMNEFIEPAQSALKFEYHEKLQEYYVTIIDSETKEVIKEVPPKRMLDMYASMAEFLGFIVDEKM